MMESPRRRTPLSDQTNTTTTTPFSAAATQPKPKPLKPYTAMTRTRPTTTCSPKSNSSIGSNLPETVLESDKTHVSETRKDKQKASPEDLLFIDIFHPRQPLGELVKLFANHIGLESAELTLNGPIQQTMVQMCQEAGPITLRKAVNIDSSDETQSAQTRKDKGKAVLRGGRRSVAPGTSEETPVAKTRKDKKNVIPEDTSIERFSSDSGTAWFKVDTSAGDSKSGSFSDPLPLHKKMRWQRHAKPVPSMPPDEAEKLRAQYAEIDAFELPVESESE
ncbi:hypothetical protein AKJ16_DCAP01659 [Drosera capensis]